MEGHRRHGRQALIATRGLHHLAIKVRDLAAAERFYCGVLGLPVVRRWPAEVGTGERSIWVDSGDGAFLAVEVALGDGDGDEDGDGEEEEEEEEDGEEEIGLFLVALRIEAGERGQWRERLRAAGVEVYRQTAFTLYVRDPEGNRIGLSHYPETDGDPDGGRGR
jgi:glyoxylase I family protein